MIRFWVDSYRKGRASHRLRMELPRQGLIARGVDCSLIHRKIVYDRNKQGITSITDAINPEHDIIIMNKEMKPEIYTQYVRPFQKLGVPVGMDLCDNKFDVRDGDNSLTQLVPQMDFMTANNETMQQVIRQRFPNKPVYWYTDPTEREFEPAKSFAGGTLKLCWYGSIASMKYFDVDKCLTKLWTLHVPWRLDLMSNHIEQRVKAGLNNVQLHDWSYEAQGQMVRESDIVLMPLGHLQPGDQRYDRVRTKSHNRLVDAIAQGRWVVTSPMPQYRPLQKYSWQGSMLKGISYYLENKKEVRDRITQGQRWIKKRATPKTAAKQLIRIYEAIKGITIT